MLKSYKVTCKVYYDGKFENSDAYIALLEEPINKEILAKINESIKENDK